MNRAMNYENSKNSIYEEWAKAGIGNAFLFGKVMTSNQKLLLELLQVSRSECRTRCVWPGATRIGGEST